MEEKKPISHIVAGLIIAVSVFLLSVIVGLISGIGIAPNAGWLSFLFLVIGLVIFINLFGKSQNNQATFGELFSYGFKTTTMIVLINVVILLIFSFTMPELKQQALDATRLELERKKMVGSEADKVIEMTSNYFWIIMIGTSMLLIAFFGAIGSLIGAAITKKQPKNPFEQTSI